MELPLITRPTIGYIPPNSYALARFTHCKRYIHLFAARSSTSSSNNGGFNGSPSSDRQPAQIDPATDFALLANVFSRRLVVGTAAASFVALGGNLGGITSLLLGIDPEISRNLKLDLVYPVNGYKRCIDTSNGFEFVYPSSWVGDQRLLYRAVERAERERSLDPPPLQDRVHRQQAVREPIVAFGPPGTNGELNVSVIVAPVPTNFMIEKFGEPKQAGEVILSKFIVSRGSNITAMLLDAKKREDYLTKQKVVYYNLEYIVQGPSFSRHNVAVCTTFAGQLVTLNAQSPEVLWPTMKGKFYEIANSFKLIPIP
eukprot:Gb_28899 [translate_table: standard]